MNPGDKRLAMLVEDHPMDYNTFEGTIPKGNYGAGTVMVWDRGTYGTYEPKSRKEAEKELKAGFAKGDLKFRLRGTKLAGTFALVKIKGRGGEENTWLLIKKDDEDATTKDVGKQDRSAKTGRSMNEIAGAKGKTWQSNKPEKQQAKGTDAMPRKLTPMLTTAVDAPFDKDGWLFEIKWDGYRAIAEVTGGKVELYSRNQLSFTSRYEPLVDELQGLGHDAVLDGEVVVLDDDGRSRFQLLQNYMKTGEGDLRYYAFDILWLDGYDLRKQPLVDRKELLRELLGDGQRVLFSDHVKKAGKAFYLAAEQQGLEGIIGKDAASPYRMGRRTGEWVKVKTETRQEAVVGGFTTPQGSRKGFGALVLGVYEGNDLVYIGHTGTGFNEKVLAGMHRKLKRLARKNSPFATPPKTNTPATWVKPELVAEVKFQEWTEDGHMRKPVFMGLREDKRVAEVRREQPKSPAEGASGQATNPDEELRVKIGSRELKLTNLAKVYWPARTGSGGPDDGYTKRDLITYYRGMAKTILPYLKDRPESLNRHPGGINEQGFYQKDVRDQPPAWVKTKKIYSESNEANINYLVCNDEATLVYLANLGCIELNPWHSRTDKLKHPDYLLIDLDPEDISFDEVVRAAKEVKTVLDSAGVPSYCKTSGATGLHICVPLGRKYTYDQTKQFAEIVVNIVHTKLPDTTSLERSPAKRQGKIYLDYLQNRKGQTMAAPYCLRPRQKAPVSTPLEWREVRKGLDPTKFNIETIAKRLDAKGDLWKPVLGKGIDLQKALTKLTDTA